MANSIAYMSIVLWPIVVWFMLVKFGLQKGILFSMLASYLFLPASFSINLPGIPAFNKGTVTVIALLLYLFFVNRRSIGFLDLNSVSKCVVLLLLVSPFLTALNNADRYLHLPGMNLYDGLSQSVGGFLIFIPFLLGFKYFRDYGSQVLLFRVFVIYVIFYSIFILYEIRMSPQLHTMLYGYFPHSFAQQYRAGGFRAVVFLGHGLLVALLVSIAFMISVALYRARIEIFKNKSLNLYVCIFLFIVLVLSKSYAALFFGIFALIVIRFMNIKMIFVSSFVLLFIYFSYPILSASKLFPHGPMLELASAIDPARAQSLGFRFYHEEQLLNHANVKPLLGWGTWGRNRVYDPDTFEDVSVTDGRWVIVLGTRGWLGFLSEFYFIMLCILLSFRASQRVVYKEASIDKVKIQQFLLASHALIVSIILIDQLPNASMNYFYWFLAGTLLGRASDVLKDKKI